MNKLIIFANIIHDVMNDHFQSMPNLTTNLIMHRALSVVCLATVWEGTAAWLGAGLSFATRSSVHLTLSPHHLGLEIQL